MDWKDNLNEIIGSPESETLEYKAVLPPARTLGRLISAFANQRGGIIILGVSEMTGEINVSGLSADFRANSVTHKAIDLLQPRPEVQFGYITHNGKRLFAIKVIASNLPVSLDGKTYTRVGDSVISDTAERTEFHADILPSIKEMVEKLESFSTSRTGAKAKFIEHYESIFNIMAELKDKLYPVSGAEPTGHKEGKVLMRVLFSSCVDNFETYLSELLYEIYLAKPETLKSGQTVTVKEVLDCNDIQEFVVYFSKKKLAKLQRGSVKGFLKENRQIADLDVLDESQQDAVERIFQIRHLYAHRNGIVDEKFLQYISNPYGLNEEHRLSMDEMIGYTLELASLVDGIDKAAIDKYLLATID